MARSTIASALISQHAAGSLSARGKLLLISAKRRIHTSAPACSHNASDPFIRPDFSGKTLHHPVCHAFQGISVIPCSPLSKFIVCALLCAPPQPHFMLLLCVDIGADPRLLHPLFRQRLRGHAQHSPTQEGDRKLFVYFFHRLLAPDIFMREFTLRKSRRLCIGSPTTTRKPTAITPEPCTDFAESTAPLGIGQLRWVLAISGFYSIKCLRNFASSCWAHLQSGYCLI